MTSEQLPAQQPNEWHNTLPNASLEPKISDRQGLDGAINTLAKGVCCLMSQVSPERKEAANEYFFNQKLLPPPTDRRLEPNEPVEISGWIIQEQTADQDDSTQPLPRLVSSMAHKMQKQNDTLSLSRLIATAHKNFRDILLATENGVLSIQIVKFTDDDGWRVVSYDQAHVTGLNEPFVVAEMYQEYYQKLHSLMVERFGPELPHAPNEWNLRPNDGRIEASSVPSIDEIVKEQIYSRIMGSSESSTDTTPVIGTQPERWPIYNGSIQEAYKEALASLCNEALAIVEQHLEIYYGSENRKLQISGSYQNGNVTMTYDSSSTGAKAIRLDLQGDAPETYYLMNNTEWEPDQLPVPARLTGLVSDLLKILSESGTVELNQEA